MKKFLTLTIVLTILHFYSKSQSSFPVFTDNPLWNVYGSDNVWSGFVTWEFEYLYDTILCGLQYTKVKNDPNTINAYVRSVDHKVYLRHNNICSEKEYLVYDFSLGIGDTVYCGYDIYDTTQFWVHIIDTIRYFGVDRKRMLMKYYKGTPPSVIIASMYWVEGIGSLTHPFYPAVYLTDNYETSYTLLCLHASGNQLYQNPDYTTCHIYMGVNEINNHEGFSVYPNPFSKTLIIDYNANNSNEGILQIFTSEKKIIFQSMVYDGRNEFQILRTFPAGIYFINIIDKDSFTTKKIIKIEP